MNEKDAQALRTLVANVVRQAWRTGSLEPGSASWKRSNAVAERLEAQLTTMIDRLTR